MSAIFGIYRFNQGPVAREDLERMQRALKPYGPEGGGIWNQQQIGLGECQMIFTPEDRFEAQPLVSSDGKRVLVFSGRFDNRRELLNQLGLSKIDGDELPDSALVLLAYEKWKNACLERLIGNYVFAIWDDRTKSVLISRAPMSNLPLFYHATPDTFAFASMRKGLFALAHIRRELDPQVLADYLAMIPVDPEAGFYREIKRLPKGHTIILTPEGFKVERTWQIDLVKTIHYPRVEDYIEAFSELFTQVVGDQLRCLAPIGIMMSGGLDSSSVASIAAPLLKESKQKLAAFTEVPGSGFDGSIIDGRYGDETPFVQGIAALYDNLELNLIQTGKQFYLDDLESFFEATEVPFRNASNRGYIEAIYKAAMGQGIHTLLTGGQGNLTISWTGSGLLTQLLKEGRFGRAVQEARAMAREGFSRSAYRTLIRQGILPLLPKPVWLAMQSLRGQNGIQLKDMKNKSPWQAYSAIHPDFARKQRVFERAREKGHDFYIRQDDNTRMRRLHVIENVGNLFDGLETGYQAIYGMETRDPTTDPRMVEFCLALPEEIYMRDGIPRWLIRNAMRGKLPEKVLWNKMRGLQAADWFESLSEAQPKVMDTLERFETSALVGEVIDLPRLRSLANELSGCREAPQELMRDYRQVLEWGLMTGSFILWCETGHL